MTLAEYQHSPGTQRSQLTNSTYPAQSPAPPRQQLRQAQDIDVRGGGYINGDGLDDLRLGAPVIDELPDVSLTRIGLCRYWEGGHCDS